MNEYDGSEGGVVDGRQQQQGKKGKRGSNLAHDCAAALRILGAFDVYM